MHHRWGFESPAASIAPLVVRYFSRCLSALDRGEIHSAREILERQAWGRDIDMTRISEDIILETKGLGDEALAALHSGGEQETRAIIEKAIQLWS